MKPTRRRIHVTVSDTTVHLLNSIAKENNCLGIGHSVDILAEHWKDTSALGCREDVLAEKVAEQVLEKVREDSQAKFEEAIRELEARQLMRREEGRIGREFNEIYEASKKDGM